MSHTFRFFGNKVAECFWSLEGFETDHARKVLKLKVGDTVEVMDGKGRVAIGAVREIVRDQILVAAGQETFEPKPTIRKALALGALKPGDLDDILPGLIEWGLDEIYVFQQRDTAKFRTSEKAQERWERIAMAAVKQCKRTWMPVVATLDSLDDMLQALTSFDGKFVLDAAGRKPLLASLDAEKRLSIAAIVGGERGLDEVELSKCVSAGFTCVNIGPHILRATTAALGTAALLATQ